MLLFLRTRFRLPFRILVLAFVALGAACGEIVSDDGGDDDIIDPPGDDIVACDEASDCQSGEGCVQNANGDGECRASCTLFDAGSCPSGETCELVAAFDPADTMLTYCRTIGVVETWQSCGAGDPCVADHSCFGGTCVPHCDDEHLCDDTDLTCTPPPNYPFANPSNAGACQ